MLEKRLPIPAYDHLLKCSHTFNILDARGAVGVTERANCFATMRALAREVTGGCGTRCVGGGAVGFGHHRARLTFHPMVFPATPLSHQRIGCSHYSLAHNSPHPSIHTQPGHL